MFYAIKSTPLFFIPFALKIPVNKMSDLVSNPPIGIISLVLLEMRGVESKTHETSTDKTGDGDGHDPREDEKENSLPVDSLDTAVAETNTDGSTSDTHGGRHGELVLREDKDSNGGAHLHGGTTAGRVVGDLVTHDY
jgi:hypothetical protein